MKVFVFLYMISKQILIHKITFNRREHKKLGLEKSTHKQILFIKIFIDPRLDIFTF